MFYRDILAYSVYDTKYVKRLVHLLKKGHNQMKPKCVDLAGLSGHHSFPAEEISNIL